MRVPSRSINGPDAPFMMVYANRKAETTRE